MPVPDLPERVGELVGAAEHTLDSAQSITAVSREHSAQKEGTLTIATTHTQARYALPGVLRRQADGGKVLVEACDRELKAKLATGELTAVDNQVDVATGTVKLKATFKNDDAALFPNQFVNVKMLIDTRQEATTVASAALQRGAAQQLSARRGGAHV